MRIAYLDCFAGISGDMFLGALVDAGVPPPVLEEAAEAMKVGASLQFETVDRSGISAKKVHVLDRGRLADAPGVSGLAVQQQSQPYAQHAKTQHQHGTGHSSLPTIEDMAELHTHDFGSAHGRSLREIRSLIQESALASQVKTLAIHVFELLGNSEAKIHNVPMEEIHFHEVGAVDAMVDIVASSAGIVHLQIAQWHCSPVNVGGGMIRCAHGVFPVPAPATADLLRGLPTFSAHVQKELTTPTGAALLRALSPSFGPQPAMAVENIGYGAGTRNPPNFPNVLRLLIGERVSEPLPAHKAEESAVVPDQRQAHSHAAQTVAVLETALDDTTPQVLAYVAELALKLGALDVMLTPVVMKKGRPGTMLTVLANPEDASRFEQMLLRETTTLGLRVRQERRVCLDRAHTIVHTLFGSIRVKTGSLNGETLNAHPEFEDCRRIAEERGVPLKQVHAAAVAAYLNQADGEPAA